MAKNIERQPSKTILDEKKQNSTPCFNPFSVLIL